MGFSVFMLILIILLCLIVVKATILQFSLFVVIKEKVDFTYTIIPAALSLLAHFTLIIIATIVLFKFDISAVNIFYSYIFNLNFSFRNLLYMFAAYFMEELIYLFFQAFILKFVTFDWIFKINKFINARQKEKSQALQVYNARDNIVSIKEKLTYFNRFILCLLCSAVCFFMFFLLFYLGRIIGSIVFSKIAS